MKKNNFMFILSLVAILITAYSSKTIVYAESTNTGTLAAQLKELGMYMGVGENDDGTVNFDLNRAPTRTEALVMLVRALGKGDVAADYEKTHPFTDVPNWADGYVSYAYDNGLTSGVSETQFGSDGLVSEEMYLTFILRALGYEDGDEEMGDGDFYWNAPWALASWCGLLTTPPDRTEFLRNDVVNLTCAALYTNLKGTQTPLYEHLISQSVFTEDQFLKTFPEYPFSDFRRINEEISSIINEQEHLGMTGNDSYSMELHMILDTTEADGSLKISTLVGLGRMTIDKDNTFMSSSWSAELWLIELDADTLKYRSCLKAGDIRAEGDNVTDYFSKEVMDSQYLLVNGAYNVGKMIVQAQIDAGQASYTPPTYEESLEKTSTAPFYYVTQTIEAEPCTILVGQTGGIPHGGGTYMYLIYKPGSAKGEGEVVSLPLPAADGWGTPAAPKDLTFDKDTLSLSYSVHFGDSMSIDGASHEAGTYNYTVDLVSGETTLVILKDE